MKFYKLEIISAWLLFAITLVMAAIFKADWLGWVLLGASFVSLASVQRIYIDRKIFCILFLILLLHQALSILNFYIFKAGLVAANTDTFWFHNTAVDFMRAHIFKFQQGTEFYPSLLSLVYYICPSRFLGQEISVFVFLLTCIMLLKLADVWGCNKHIGLVLLVYGLLPNQITATIIISTEPWQILSFMLALYYGFIWHTDKKIVSLATLYFFVALILLAYLHKGFGAFIVFFALMYVMLAFSKPVVKMPTLIYKLILTIMFLIPLIISLLPYDASLSLLKFNWHRQVQYVQQYQTMVVGFGANSNYTTTVVQQGFVLHAIIGFIKYLCGPFPWEVNNLKYLFVMLCSWARLLFIGLVVYQLIISNKQKRLLLAVLLLIYFAFAGLYSLGTVNYGTAYRHNVITDWLLLLLAMPVLVEVVQRSMAKIRHSQIDSKS